MKKIISLALAVMLITTMSVTAFAATIEGESGTVDVTYGVSESYTVTIPASTSLTENGVSMEVSTKDVVIPYGNQLTVSISSNNYNEGKWYLVDSANTSNKLEYSMKNGENDVASDSTILTVAAGTTDEQKVTLTATLVGTATYSGTYKDTLTFNVSVASASGSTTETWTTVTDENGLKTALQAGGKIKLGANIELTNMIQIEPSSANLDITLDLNGHFITEDASFPEGYNMLQFSNDSTKALKLTIQDSSDAKTGKIEGTAALSAVYVATGSENHSSEIILESGTLSGYYALMVAGYAKATVSGGTLIGIDTDFATLCLNGRYTSAVISGGTILSGENGDAIQLMQSDNKLEITDGEIHGKIDVLSGATPTITGGTFTFDPSAYVDTDNYKVIGTPVSNPTMWMVVEK